MANIIEEQLIRKYNSMNNKIGYNMKAGGTNYTVRKEVRIRRGEKFKGKPRSEETKRKISQKLTGRKRGNLSEEQKQKISISNK